MRRGRAARGTRDRDSRDSASSPESREAVERDQEAAHADGIRGWLKKMRHPGRAGVEYPYVTSLSGAKRLIYRPPPPSGPGPTGSRSNSAGSQRR